MPDNETNERRTPRAADATHHCKIIMCRDFGATDAPLQRMTWRGETAERQQETTQGGSKATGEKQRNEDETTNNTKEATRAERKPGAGDERSTQGRRIGGKPAEKARGETCSPSPWMSGALCRRAREQVPGQAEMPTCIDTTLRPSSEGACTGGPETRPSARAAARGEGGAEATTNVGCIDTSVSDKLNAIGNRKLASERNLLPQSEITAPMLGRSLTSSLRHPPTTPSHGSLHGGRKQDGNTGRRAPRSGISLSLSFSLSALL